MDTGGAQVSEHLVHAVKVVGLKELPVEPPVGMSTLALTAAQHADIECPPFRSRLDL
jgi:hypothetical protein